VIHQSSSHGGRLRLPGSLNFSQFVAAQKHVK
jgi:hypothetical protein